MQPYYTTNIHQYPHITTTDLIDLMVEQIFTEDFNTFKELRNVTDKVYYEYNGNKNISKRLLRKIVYVIMRKRQESDGRYHAQRQGNKYIIKYYLERFNYYKHKFKKSTSSKLKHEHQ